MSDTVDRGLYGIILLKSKDEGIEVEYDENKLESEIKDCIQFLETLHRGYSDKSILNSIEIEIIQNATAKREMGKAIDLMKEYAENFSVDSQYEDVTRMLRRIEQFVQSELERVSPTRV